MMPGVIAAIQATARIPRRGRGGRLETPETAEARARVDVALALTLRDGGLRVSEAAALAWSDVERWPDGSGRLTIRRSKTDPTGEGAVVAVTPACVRSLEAIRPADPDDQASVFRLSIRQMANRVKAACHATGLEGDAFSGHSGRVGLARTQRRPLAGWRRVTVLDSCQTSKHPHQQGQLLRHQEVPVMGLGGE